MRLSFDFDSGGPGGRGGWTVVALALIVVAGIVAVLTLGAR